MSIQPYKSFEERRYYPRISITEPVTVKHRENEFEGIIHDISADGIQVRCTRKSFHMIHPTGRFIKKENAPVVDVDFNIKINGQYEKIRVRGLIYYFVVLPEEKNLDIAFGLRFISLDDETIKAINDFIETAMIPDDDMYHTIMEEPNKLSDLKNTKELNSYDMQTTLLALLKKHEVSISGLIEKDRHQCLATCIETLFDKLAELDNRIYRIEDNSVKD